MPLWCLAIGKFDLCFKRWEALRHTQGWVQDTPTLSVKMWWRGGGGEHTEFKITLHEKAILLMNTALSITMKQLKLVLRSKKV